jgi:hypothetical protein
MARLQQGRELASCMPRPSFRSTTSVPSRKFPPAKDHIHQMFFCIFSQQKVDALNSKRWVSPGIEPGTTRSIDLEFSRDAVRRTSLSEYHTARPRDLIDAYVIDENRSSCWVYEVRMHMFDHCQTQELLLRAISYFKPSLSSMSHFKPKAQSCPSHQQ